MAQRAHAPRAPRTPRPRTPRPRTYVRTRHRLRNVRLTLAAPTQPSQPAESALSVERVCKATSVLRGTHLDI